MGAYLGIDIGTTHIKTALISSEGDVIYLVKNRTKSKKDMHGEVYDCVEIFNTVVSQLNECLDTDLDVLGIAITGMAESGLIIDSTTQEPETDIIPWFDLRTLELSRNIDESEERMLFTKTGLRNSYKYGIYKYLWLLENNNLEKENTVWLSICDYILMKLTGVIATEHTFAARTYVYNVFDRCWDESLLSKYELSENQFPKILNSGEVAGLYKGIPVALCGHDHICCAYGISLTKDSICNSMGTAETYVSIEHCIENVNELYDKGIVFGPYVKEGIYYTMANISSSGGSIEWIRSAVQKESISYEELNSMLEDTKNPTNILYYPFLSGIGTPTFNTKVKAAFLGLSNEHKINDIVKSVVEGISYQSKLVIEKSFENKNEIVCVGGAVNSKQWLQIKSDIIEKKIIVPNIIEGTIFGAVKLLAEKIERENKIYINDKLNTFVPDCEIAKEYKKIYEYGYLKKLPLILN